MPQQIPCDGCETNPAVMLVTLIETGSVIGLCPPCSMVWAEGHAAAIRARMEDNAAGPDGGAATEGEPAPGAESAAESGRNDETMGGGEDDGDVRARDSEPEGVPASGAGEAGADDAGEDHGGRGEGGSGSGGQPGSALGIGDRDGQLIAGP